MGTQGLSSSQRAHHRLPPTWCCGQRSADLWVFEASLLYRASSIPTERSVVEKGPHLPWPGTHDVGFPSVFWVSSSEHICLLSWELKTLTLDVITEQWVLIALFCFLAISILSNILCSNNYSFFCFLLIMFWLCFFLLKSKELIPVFYAVLIW